MLTGPLKSVDRSHIDPFAFFDADSASQTFLIYLVIFDRKRNTRFCADEIYFKNLVLNLPNATFGLVLLGLLLFSSNVSGDQTWFSKKLDQLNKQTKLNNRFSFWNPWRVGGGFIRMFKDYAHISNVEKQKHWDVKYFHFRIDPRFSFGDICILGRRRVPLG